jgi:hypothetical protein
MITFITAWITEKIVGVLAVSLVVVSAVPTALVLTTEHQTTVVLQQQQADQKIILVQTVSKAGDELIVKLKGAEQSCNTQVATLVPDPAKVQTQLADAQNQVHASILPAIAAIQQRQANFAKLAVVDTRDAEDELSQIRLIEVMMLGINGTIGTVTVTCQTVGVWIQHVVLIVSSPSQTVTIRPKQCHYHYEKDGPQVKVEYDCD